MKSKRIIWLSLLITMAMLASQTWAGLIPGESLLPASSLYDGHTYYSEKVETTTGTLYMQGRIDFAVYDTLGGNEWVKAGKNEPTPWSNPGSGRYVYAYQIFNDYQNVSEVAIEAFSIFGLNGAQISIDQTSVQTEVDPAGGQDAYDTTFSDTTVSWNFTYNSSLGDYTIGTTEHSYFLIFSSDQNWVKGDYSLTAYEAATPMPGSGINANGSNVPEPTTVALLGIGGLVTCLKRKKK